MPESVAEPTADGAIALEDLIAEHQERVARLAARLLDRPDDVGDVVQEVFLAALRNRRRFRGESKLSTWLSAITVNTCRSHGRRRGLMRRAWQRLVAQAERAAEPPPPDNAAEVHDEVRRAVARLPSRYREPVVLRYFEEYPIAQIADVLGISPNNVEVRLSRARTKLRDILALRLKET